MSLQLMKEALSFWEYGLENDEELSYYYERFVDASCMNAAMTHPMEYALRGLAGEVGEVQEEAKKYLRDIGDTGPIKDDHECNPKFIDELGDVLWYVTRLAIIHNVSLNELQNHTMKKLIAKREKNGV